MSEHTVSGCLSLSQPTSKPVSETVNQSVNVSESSVIESISVMVGEYLLYYKRTVLGHSLK